MTILPFMNTILFLPFSKIYLLTWKSELQRNGETERNLLFLGSLPACLQWPKLANLKPGAQNVFEGCPCGCRGFVVVLSSADFLWALAGNWVRSRVSGMLAPLKQVTWLPSSTRVMVSSFDFFLWKDMFLIHSIIIA